MRRSRSPWRIETGRSGEKTMVCLATPRRRRIRRAGAAPDGCWPTAAGSNSTSPSVLPASMRPIAGAKDREAFELLPRQAIVHTVEAHGAIVRVDPDQATHAGQPHCVRRHRPPARSASSAGNRGGYRCLFSSAMSHHPSDRPPAHQSAPARPGRRRPWRSHRRIDPAMHRAPLRIAVAPAFHISRPCDPASHTPPSGARSDLLDARSGRQATAYREASSATRAPRRRGPARRRVGSLAQISAVGGLGEAGFARQRGIGAESVRGPA